MNIFAVIAMVLGIVVFVAVHFGVQRRWANLALGLVLVWVGLMLQLLIQTEHLITINWR